MRGRDGKAALRDVPIFPGGRAGGQRRIGVLRLKARILEKEGKPAAAVVQEQLEVLRELPRTQRSPEQEAQLQKKLAEARKR